MKKKSYGFLWLCTLLFALPLLQLTDIPFEKPAFVLLILLLGLCIIKQKQEHSHLQNLINTQTETYISILKHEIKTPVLAQIRAIEMLLRGDFGILTPKQKEILHLTLNSCRHSYRIIYTQLNPQV